MDRTLVLLLVASTVACDKIVGDKLPVGAEAGVLAAPAVPSAPTTAVLGPAAAPPRDVPAFLARFCDAVAASDKAYVNAHSDVGFTSSRGPDPEAPGGGGRRKRTVGLRHADGVDFTPFCTRVRTQPAGEIARRVREQDGKLLVRLREDGLASDVVIERNGADFRILREDEPNAKKQAGGGGGGW